MIGVWHLQKCEVFPEVTSKLERSVEEEMAEA